MYTHQHAITPECRVLVHLTWMRCLRESMKTNLLTNPLVVIVSMVMTQTLTVTIVIIFTLPVEFWIRKMPFSVWRSDACGVAIIIITVWLSLSMLTYYMLEYPEMCTCPPPSQVHASVDNQWLCFDFLNTFLYLLSLSVSSDYTYIEKSCYISFLIEVSPSMLKINACEASLQNSQRLISYFC